MNSKKDLQKFLDKVKKLEKTNQFDLSSDEDLSIAIMNLISIEEHLFFSGARTGKTKYYDLLNQIRILRTDLLKKIIPDYEGEVWCISKHLLAASMRVMEVGTKTLKKGDEKGAAALFKKSYDLYNLFWGLNLGLVKSDRVGAIHASPNPKEDPVKLDKSDFLGKISGVINKVLDCCRE